jgi:osmoprotectant transport system permease protein
MSSALWQQLTLLPDRLGYHMLLTVCALSAGLAISFSLALAAVHWPRLRDTLIGIASVIQTVPSLALLALMVPLLGTIGFAPAVIALILYSLLPMLRNTVTGIVNVDPAMVEAARGIGMTERQTLFRVQLPLAMPVIIAGIRTSAVWVVGIATLSTPVGQQSLGDYIFQGLRLRNNTAILVGCAAAAGLAIVLDLLIRLAETASVRRSKPMFITALLGLGIVGLGGMTPLLRRPPDAFVGTKTFTEQYIFGQMVSGALKDAGFRPQVRRDMGSSVLFNSLVNGSIDCYVDYSGTIWSNVMKRTDQPDRDAMLAEITIYLKDRYGIVNAGELGFENTYAIAIRDDDAKAWRVNTIADLAPRAPRLSIGGDYEFFGRPEWAAVKQSYGLRFNQVVNLDSSLMYGAIRDRQVDAISAFSTDGRLDAFHLKVLKDPKHAFPPYDAILLVSQQAAAREGFLDALSPLIGSVSDVKMRRLNKAVDVDHRSPADAIELH